MLRSSKLHNITSLAFQFYGRYFSRLANLPKPWFTSSLESMQKNLFLLITLVTIFGNYLSNVTALTGRSIGELSDIYSTRLTPAGFTFSIWFFIYLGLLYIGWLFARGKLTWSRELLPWYALASGLNLGWLLVWQQERLFAAAIILVSLALVNFGIVRLFRTHQAARTVTLPTQLYLMYATWTLLASFISVTTYLQYGLGFEGAGLSAATWVSGILWLLAGVAAYLVRARNYFAFGLVYVWAVFGIVSAQSASAIVMSGWLAGALILVLTMATWWRRRSLSAKE